MHTHRHELVEQHTPLLAGNSTEDHKLKLLLSIQQELRRANRQLYNHANPVDDFETIGTTGTTTIRADYDSPVMYECLLYCLPLGTTAAALQIGTSRTIPLYSGTAITIQQPVVLPHLNLIVDGGDVRRTLTVAGASNNGYIGLMGYALGRELNDK